MAVCADEAIVRVLDWTRRNRDCVFRERWLARIIGSEEPIARLVEIGFVRHACEDVLVVVDRDDGHVLEHVARVLRPHDRIMASYQYAASAEGLVTRIVASGLTCATDGEPGEWETPLIGNRRHVLLWHAERAQTRCHRCLCEAARRVRGTRSLHHPAKASRPRERSKP